MPKMLVNIGDLRKDIMACEMIEGVVLHYPSRIYKLNLIHEKGVLS